MMRCLVLVWWSSPARQHLTGTRREVIIQSGCAVLQSHQSSLEVRFRVQLDL